MNVTQRGRSVAVLGLLLAAALMLVSMLMPWWTLTLADRAPVQLRGTDVAGGIAAIGLAVAVASLVIALSGVLLARVLGGIVTVLGGLAAAVLVSSARPVAAFERVIASLVGVTSSDYEAAATAAPVLAWLGVALTVALGIWCVVTRPRWKQRAKKTSRFARNDPGLAWDALDDGVDPTAESGTESTPESR